MKTYAVWSLEVWGHGSHECCASFDCPCIVTDPETGAETHDTDHHECDASYDVNDRCRVGTVDIDEDSAAYAIDPEAAILSALESAEYVHADKCAVDDLGDEDHHYINSKEGRPLLQLEAQ